MSEKKNMTNPLISVVIPVYNMEKYLKRCMESILAQTYEQLQIILVDDCSTDSSAKIIDSYVKSDDRVVTVRHKKNRGLFQARITGSEIATGKYIAFVDSDDYISLDWFRKLVRQAEATQSDIVVGEWCYDNDGKHKDYINLDHFRIQDYCLEGTAVMDTFMENQGRNFSWTVVWNKLYTKQLWDKCYPMYTAFSEAHGHMIMWEDIAFSSALFANAKKVTNVHGILYFYFKHADASTAASKNKAKNNKYIADASSAMKFVKDVLVAGGLYETYEDAYLAWKKHGMAIVYKDLVINLGKPAYRKAILQAFDCDAYDFEEEQEDFFQTLTTPINNSLSWWEDIVRSITSVSTRYVSFDIFDTLIQRPFLYPTDLFELLSERFNKNLSAFVNFRTLREHAEKAVRDLQWQRHPSREEITLDEIYQYLKDNYAFRPELLDEIKQYEIELEVRYCTQRKIGRELFDLALESGKDVIICSDMYLTRDVVERILEKNGYTGYRKLYLSSDLELTKGSKRLYTYVQKDLGCTNANAFVHIGDNYDSDVRNSSACGWRTGHLAKASDMVLNQNPGIYGGEAFHKLYRCSMFKEDYRLAFNDFTAIRTMTALVGNRFFDNPYVSVNPWSDFNSDPRMVGYAALGPHLLALSRWIYTVAKRNNIGTVHFVARDGYMVKQAFDSFHYPDVKSNYIRLSRKALVLADVNCVEDLYSIFSKMSVLSPEKLAKNLDPIIPGDKKAGLEEFFLRHNLNYRNNLTSSVEWERCLKLFIDHVIDIDLLPAYKAKLKEYFSAIVSPGDYLFDIGYSGRPEASLSSILGFPVGSLYIHVNNQVAMIRQSKYNCPSEIFYQFKPSITGVIREHLLMELGPSTVGYEEVDGKLTPKLEDYKAEYCSNLITRIVQENALQFVRDYVQLFGEYDIMFNFQNEVMSAPLEYYLHFSKHPDRKIFATLPFEDDLGEGKTMRALHFWDREISVRQMGAEVTGGLQGDLIPGVYIDGYFMKLAKFLNRLFPRGSRSRNAVKKIAKLFLK